MITPLVRPSPHLTEHENRAQWKLGRGQGKRFPRRRLVHSVHFVEDLARPDFSDEVLRVSLAVAHPHLCGLLRGGFVRVVTVDDALVSFVVVCFSTACCVYLARCNSSGGITGL